MKFIIYLFTLILFITNAFPSQCKKYFKEQEFLVTQINALEKLGYVQTKDLPIIRGPNDLIIGLATYGHAYLIFNGFRFEGSPLTFKYLKKTDLTNYGILLKFELDEKTSVLLKENMLKSAGQLSFTCIHDICRLMSNSGITIKRAGPWWTNMGPGLIEHLITDGIVIQQNKEVVKADIYFINSEEDNLFEVFSENFNEATMNTALQYGVVGVGIITISGLIAGVVIAMNSR